MRICLDIDIYLYTYDIRYINNNNIYTYNSNISTHNIYTKYSYIYPEIKIVQQEFESKFFKVQPAIEQAAMTLYKEDPKLATDFLTDYSVGQANEVFDRWQKLWKHLVVKYNDGYINDVSKNGGRSPKGVSYGDYYLKKILEERPGYYDLKWKDEPVK